MRLVQFTSRYSNGPVWINPDHVTRVQSLHSRSETEIYIVGKESAITVTMTPDVVVRLLTEGS